MRHALAYETVGLCQACGEALTSRDVLETGQARLCQDCWEAGRTTEQYALEA
jgi:formylmethanofuran dehydrogenase subunit E